MYCMCELAESFEQGAVWKRRLEQDDCFGPPVVALGKFDALHRGHQQLAIKAVHLGGTPYLVSFVGMADILGWEPRLPLVAPMDRSRVLASWKAACLGAIPKEHRIPFSNIRELSPEEFVALLSQDLGVKGVVVGSNYRFGYKAAGTARTLKTLGAEYGMKVDIVNLLENYQDMKNGLGDVVSSSKIREALWTGDMALVEQCMGRGYRLVSRLAGHVLRQNRIIEYSACMNQYPKVGEYQVILWITNAAVDASKVDGYHTKVVFSDLGIHFSEGPMLENVNLDDDVYCIFQF